MLEPFTYQNDFAAFITAIDRGECCLIDEEMSDYFLEVLPPVSMGRKVTLVNGREQYSLFEFAEGAEITRAFWRERKDDGTVQHYAQNTNRMNPYA